MADQGNARPTSPISSQTAARAESQERPISAVRCQDWAAHASAGDAVTVPSCLKIGLWMAMWHVRPALLH